MMVGKCHYLGKRAVSILAKKKGFVRKPVCRRLLLPDKNYLPPSSHPPIPPSVFRIRKDFFAFLEEPVEVDDGDTK